MKSLLKLEQYAGEREKFLGFKWQLYVAVRVLSPDLLAMMEWVEKNTSKDYKISTMTPDEQKLEGEAYTI